MNKIILGLAFAGLLGAPAAAAGDTAPAKSESVTMQGEVLDLACYMAHEAAGPKHAKCAKMCLTGGSPAGLLGKDGSVTLLLENHGKNAKAFAAVKSLAGEQVSVTGEKAARGGLQALIVEKAEKAK